MMNKIRLIIANFIVFISVDLVCTQDRATDLLAFSKSFINALSVAPEGKFTREYHPYLLQKTIASLVQLESAVCDAGIICKDRIALMGYEQNAVPNYGYCLSSPTLADESVVKSPGGWSFAPTNIFGYLTGFLLKDAQEFNIAGIQHQLACTVELFKPETESLQQHAFGQAYDMICHHNALINEAVAKNNATQVLEHLATFWEQIYSQATTTANQSDAATQDILFSLFYARHLINNKIPVQTIFTGPDITYPITVSLAQAAQVTRNAQWFVNHMAQQLQPRDNQKTAYIFCSFVDGVGKSTMLGNLQNYRLHGTNFSAYSSVNNSSSQLATVYDYAENVVLVDLPAQLSHFTPKPDGYVFVDLEHCPSMDIHTIKQIQQHVRVQASRLIESADIRLRQLQAGATVEIDNLADAMLGNCASLGISSTWVPCTYEGNTYVFSRTNNDHVRLCVPLEHTPSQGLKITEPELMIFNRGLFIPMSYQSFVNDLISQLHNNGVEQVVFIDFMSMYPRSSRETVRINYLLQHLKRFYAEDVDLAAIIGMPMAHRQGLYALLFDCYDKAERGLFVETLMRWVLHTLIAQASDNNVSIINDATLQQRLREAVRALHEPAMADAVQQVLAIVRSKLLQERQQYQHYEFGTFYQSVLTTSWQTMIEASQWHVETIANTHQMGEVRARWQQLLGDIVDVDIVGKKATTANGAHLQIMQILPDTLQADLLTKFNTIIRPLWLDQLIGTAYGDSMLARYTEAIVFKQLPDGKFALCCIVHEEFKGKQQTVQLPPALYTLGYSASSQDDISTFNTLMGSLRHDFFSQYNEPIESFIVPIAAVWNSIEGMPSIFHGHGYGSARQRPVEYIGPVAIAELAEYAARLYSYCKSPTDALMIRHNNEQDMQAAHMLFAHYLLPVVAGLQ